MKSNSVFLSILFLSAISIFGCKSNPSAPGSSAPAVKIIPSDFHGGEFVVDTFKAKIDNHDFAETYFKWDMGDSTLVSNPPPFSFEAIHIYTKPGTYKITVKAYDIYTNQIIAADSLIALIDTAKSSVEIIPQFYNGSLTTNTLGACDRFTFSVKTSLPFSDIDQFWDYGDGTTDSLRYGATAVQHGFPHPGTFLVKVNLFQKNGIYVGSDTALITIHIPDISLDMLKQSTRFEEFFYVDSSNSQFNYVSAYLPFVMALHFWNDSTHVSTWNGNDFSIKYHSVASGIQDDSIGGTISSDLKSISLLKVSARKFYTSNVNGEYGFTAANLTLIGVTVANKIIFRLSGNNSKNNLQSSLLNILGITDITVLSRIGANDDWRSFIRPDRPTDPVCILVFDRE